MGGGGAVSTAAKVAGIGVLNGGLRGMPTMPAAEQSVRSATRPVSAIMSSSATVAPKTASADVSPMPVAWDDWEFADGELTIASGEPMSRVVFGGVPTFQEAMEATTELKDAIDMLYPSSPKSTGFADPFAADHGPDLSLVTSPESQTKSCVTFEATPTPPVPKHVLQAFKLLSGSPKVQTVVASIASDPNILNAVMDNPELKDFLSSQQRNDEFPEPQSPKKLQESSDASQTENSKSAFIDVRGMVRKVKRSVLEMVSNVSNYFQHIFGPSEADSHASDASENTKSTFVDTTLGKTVIGLAIVVVMVVVLKRA